MEPKLFWDLELEPEPKICPKSKPKINTFGSATLGTCVVSELPADRNSTLEKAILPGRDVHREIGEKSKLNRFESISSADAKGNKFVYCCGKILASGITA